MANEKWTEETRKRLEVMVDVLKDAPWSTGGDEGGAIAAALAEIERLEEIADVERQRWVQAVKGLKERIKHTSHKDGLGMGDQRSESVCDEILRELGLASKGPEA